MAKGLISKVVALFVSSTIMFTCGGLSSVTKVNAATDKPDFGVGKGVKWPEQYCAPYVDLCDYYSVEGYNSNGAPYLPKLAEDTGLRYFNIAFIQALGKSIENGKVEWAWAGLSQLTEGSTNEQYEGMKKSIRDLREMGGDVTLSFGGRDNVAIWQVTHDVDTLANTYKEIVEGYGLTRIDFDIEEGAQNPEDNIPNAQAVKKVQDETGVDVTLTVPVLPSGLTDTQMKILEIYLCAGVDVTLVNIMAMCYGSGALAPGENYGTGSVRAIDSTMKQIQEYYKKYKGIILTEAEAYKKVGVTTSVGYEGDTEPLFKPDWSKLVADHAIEKGIGMTSMWSLNRDSMLQDNKGIDAKYEHTKEYIRHGTTEVIKNCKPEIQGVKDKKIKVGQIFDPLKDVRAVDFEDGIVTNRLKVQGNVSVSVPGDYNVIYSVTDNGGQTTMVSRKITVTTENLENVKPNLIGVENKTLVTGGYFTPLYQVKAEDKEDGDISHKIQYSGNVDTSKVGKYPVEYTVTDSDNNTTVVNTVITVIDSKQYIEEFDYYKVYYGGELVRYKDKIYICTGWSTYEYPDGEWTYSWKLYDEPKDTLDLAIAASKYNCLKGNANYDSNYDVIVDGIIDIYDLVAICKNM